MRRIKRYLLAGIFTICFIGKCNMVSAQDSNLQLDSITEIYNQITDGQYFSSTDNNIIDDYENYDGIDEIGGVNNSDIESGDGDIEERYYDYVGQGISSIKSNLNILANYIYENGEYYIDSDGEYKTAVYSNGNLLDYLFGINYYYNSHKLRVIGQLKKEDTYVNTTFVIDISTGKIKDYYAAVNCELSDKVRFTGKTNSFNSMTYSENKNINFSEYNLQYMYGIDSESRQEVYNSCLQLLVKFLGGITNQYCGLTLRDIGFLGYSTSDYYNGLHLEDNGTWKYYIDNIFASDYIGLAENEYGWFYVRNGLIDWNYTGLAENQYGWFYVSNGVLDWNYTGLANNQYGWFYVSNGVLDWNYTGLAENQYGWFYVSNGVLDWNYTGLANNQYGWFYVSNGVLDWNYTGLAENQYGWFYVSNGVLDWNYTGLAENQYGWFYVSNGVLDWNYTGLAGNQYGLWLIYKGTINYAYIGVYDSNNKEYYVINGYAQEV